MTKIIKILIWPIIVIPAVYLAIIWNKLPDQVALHFNLKGNADRFGSKNELLITVIALTFFNAVIYLILTNIYRIDPKKYAADNKDRLRRMAFGIALFLSALLCMILFSSVNGNISFNTGFVLSGVGLLFAFMGNYMHNIKPNYFAGFRLPWTLENEDNWKKTHALAGKLWFGGGLILAIICLFLTPVTAFIIFFIIMIVITLIPIIFSFRYYKQQKKKP
jgi:uncharacterized membrane protein